ncbi:hypothetical protein [Streptomyces lusitanus]|uniref:Orn/Lys/Arg family decarboxylase n=1 Tax=Streptomyces TaxID=1883 RepID=UPI0036F3CA7A
MLNEKKIRRKRLPRDPFSAPRDTQKMRPCEVVRYANDLSHKIAMPPAVGSISAESVELYPPGILVLPEGYEVTREAVNYLQTARRQRAHLVARDLSLEALRVLGKRTKDSPVTARRKNRKGRSR